MSRLFAFGPVGDCDGTPFARGGTPTRDFNEFAANWTNVGSTGALVDRRYDISGSNSTGANVSKQEIFTRFKCRIWRLPTSETILWALGSTTESTPAAYLTITTTGQLNFYNQGNQVQFSQLLDNVGTVELGVWQTITIHCRYRSSGVDGFYQITRTDASGASVTSAGDVPVVGPNGFGLAYSNGALFQQTNRQLLFQSTGGGLDIDVCDFVSDDASFGAASRISHLLVAAEGVYQEFTVSGFAQYQARNMWPYAGTSTATTYAVRSNTLGNRQSYVFEPFANKGITGNILSAVVRFFVVQATIAAPTLILRRTPQGGPPSETTITLWAISGSTWAYVRLDDAVNWEPTDTIEIGVRNGANAQFSLGPMVLSVEHDSPFVPESDTDFTVAQTQWTGNGTIQEISLPNGIEPNFLLWWPATATTTSPTGGIWWEGMPNYSRIGSSIMGPTRVDMIVRGNIVQLIGAEAGGPNVSGRVYDVLLVQDRTRRMISPISVNQSSNAAYDGRDVPVTDIEGEPFTPTMVLGVLQSVATLASIYMRGPGHTGDQTSEILGSVPVANIFQALAAGEIELGNSTSIAGNQLQFAVCPWRSNFFGSAFVSISTYTGNGAAGRDITLNMPGFTPTWVIVQPISAGGVSEAGISTPSTPTTRLLTSGSAGTNSVLTIGENRITVGLTYNESGSLYNVFALGVGTDSEPEPEPDPDPFPGDPLPDPGPVPSTLNATLLRMRRLRRCAHLSNEEFRVFYHRLQIDAQVGVGLAGSEQVGSAPQMMLRWSDDGGMTWSNEHWVSLGRIGNWKRRAIWDRLGNARDRVFEITVSDPVAWRIIDAYLQTSPGNN